MVIGSFFILPGGFCAEGAAAGLSAAGASVAGGEWSFMAGLSVLTMIPVNFFPCPRRRRGSEFFSLVAPGEFERGTFSGGFDAEGFD